MHELWYKVKTPAATNEIRSYELAKLAAANGAEVEIIYKYKDFDREVINEKRKEKLLKKFF